MTVYANDLYAMSVLKEKEIKKNATLSEVFGDNAVVEDKKKNETKVPLNEA